MKQLLPVLICAIALSSCGNMIADIKEAKALQQEISTKYSFKSVGVKLVNGDRLMVTLINTPYNDSSEVARQRLTDSIAVICGKYFKRKHITEGLTSFVYEDKAGLVKTDDYHNYNMHISN